MKENAPAKIQAYSLVIAVLIADDVLHSKPMFASTPKKPPESIYANALWKAFDPQYRPTFMTFNSKGKFTADRVFADGP